MERINSLADTAIDASQLVAVLVGESVPGQRHIGLSYAADDNGRSRVLHLMWHCRLQSDDRPPDVFALWVNPGYHPRRLLQLAAYCRRVWAANEKNGIPYSLSPPNDSLDSETGAFLTGHARHGLTCASFVLAVFHGARMPIAEYATWPVNRSGDHEWQEWVVSQLTQHRAPAEHVELVRSEIGLVRFRPEDVAACAALAPPLVAFASASELGGDIVLRLQGGTTKPDPGSTKAT
jgi:hypothetical protein